jgi:hypothetical protein
MKLPRPFAAVLLMTLFFTPRATAQPAADSNVAEASSGALSAPTIASLRFVGHHRVLDTTAAQDGWYTLGDDGLVVRWSSAGVPQAWNRIDDARYLVRWAGQLAALTNESLVAMDESTLEAGLREPHDNFVRCAGDDRFWRWRNGGELLHDSGLRGTETLHPAFEPVPEALCVVAGNQSMLVWLDGDELRVLQDDGSTRTLPWPLATPTLAAIDGDPVALATSEEGERVAVNLRDGLPASVEAREVSSGCLAWDESGGSACGPPTPEHWVTQSLLPQVIVPLRSVATDNTWIASWPGGWFVLDAAATTVMVRSAETGTLLGVTGGITPRVLMCRASNDGAQLVALSVHDGAEVASISLSECPGRHWFGDDAYMGSTPEGSLLFQDDAFALATVDSAVSASAPWGRNQITFVLGRVFDPSCPAQAAWTLERRAAEGEPEPILGAQCATEAILRPLLGDSGQIAGSVVLLRESRRWRSRGFALDGAALFDLTYRTDHPEELRWVYGTNGTVEVDDFAQLSTRVASGDSWSRVALNVHRGSTPVTLGTESLRMVRADGAVDCGGSSTGWWCFDEESFWVTEGIARQVVLVMSDGRLLGAQHPEFGERRRNTPFATIVDQ